MACVTAVAMFNGAAAWGLPQNDLRITNGLDSQRYMGTGKGVIVAILDGGIDVTHPALRGNIFAERDFTGEKITDDTRRDIGHGTGVAGIMIGHDGKTYSGMAPAARLINARVSTADDRVSDLWVGNGLTWSARSGAKVANLSLGNKLGAGPLTDKLNLMVDYVTERYGVNVISAAGNENDSAPQQSPGGAYNGYCVGALAAPSYNRVTWFSNYTLPNDARTKPDLIAPGEKIDVATSDWEKYEDYYPSTGTSFAAPMVGGVLAQMIGYGKSKGLPTDPLLLKAILLTSATKVQKSEGGIWEARDGGRDQDYGYRFTQPLDDEQGAGRLDAVAAYRLYAKAKAKSTPLNLWREGKMKGNTSFTVRLGKLYAGQRVDATLAWYRHVAYKDVNDNGPDGKDTYYQSASLADFVLTLTRNGVPIAASDSDVDNLEHLSWVLEATADYALQVYRFADGGLASEQYALAARVLKGDAAAAQAYSASARSAQALVATGALKGMDSAVPEPAGAVGLALVMLIALARRGRRGL